MDHWISPEPPAFDAQHPLFLCVLSNTDTAKIPGISAAGRLPALIDYTPAGDAELVTLGRTIGNSEPPMTGNSPTPAVMTRAALQLTGMPFMFINCGLRILPQIPLLDVGAHPGGDIRNGQAVQDAGLIYENSVELGRQIRRFSDFVIIGESVPGGTTTAMAVLQALGIDGMVSSSFPKNPMDIKQQVVAQALDRAGIAFGDLLNEPMRAIEYVGDPMMACVSGLVEGLKGTPSILAGGTQMMAVMAIIKFLGIENNISIATTKYVAEDGTASFLETVSALGYAAYVVDPGLDRSKNPGLRMYESGVVKEGVGAGGAMFVAGMMGIGQRELLEKVEEICDQLF
ncbi:MAG: TIGR00303 family protein [ANME-2 cluster archaeon]|nr:TIGR00303 family protein [ANME-2 cluster archaeon]MDF1558470.1 TIGR00303 family protein [ANME-2 cluster archaeon]